MRRPANGGKEPSSVFARVVVSAFVVALLVLLTALVVVELGWFGA